MRKNKVLIIGIDGGTWRLLQPLMEEEFMPNLKAVTEEGAWGVLKSTIPPITAPAWTTFMTGVSPATHGIVEFNNYDGKYGTYFVTNASIKYKTIWELASEQGLRIISINVPMTYPPYPVRGYMITGMLTPDTSRFTYPPSLGEEILEEFGDYRILTTGKVYLLHGLDRFLQELNKTVITRADVAAYLFSSKEWDLAMVHFYSSDMAQHFLYHCIDPEHPHYDPSCREKIYGFYRTLDRAIAQVLEVSEKRGASLKILLSDHGFTRVHTTILLNSLLLKHGFFVSRGKNPAKELLWKGIKFLRRLDFLNLNRLILRGERREKLLSSIQIGNVDFSATKAFSINGWVYGNIYINLKGREPQGIVGKEDYYKLREEIRGALQEEEGIKEILTKEEAFGETESSSVPDLLVIPEEGYGFSPSFMVSKKKAYFKNKVRADHTGSHHIDGIWAVIGEGVKKGRVDANIIDLLPTILWYMGLPIPDYVEGKVVREAFREEFSRGREEKRAKISPQRDLTGKTYREDLEERLHDLGYL